MVIIVSALYSTDPRIPIDPIDISQTFAQPASTRKGLGPRTLTHWRNAVTWVSGYARLRLTSTAAAVTAWYTNSTSRPDPKYTQLAFPSFSLGVAPGGGYAYARRIGGPDPRVQVCENLWRPRSYTAGDETTCQYVRTCIQYSQSQSYYFSPHGEERVQL